MMIPKHTVTSISFMLATSVASIMAPQNAFGQSFRIDKTKTVEIEALQQQVPFNRIVILDYSGSMVERDSQNRLLKNQKYRYALETALNLVTLPEGASEDSKSGMLVFGNRLGVAKRSRYKGGILSVEQSCQDINPELEFNRMPAKGSQAISELAQRLRAQKPGGETPLRGSIEEAKRQIKGEGGAVILITDLNNSTCEEGGNPCLEIESLRRELAATSMFLTHIVSVPTSDQARSVTYKLAECVNAVNEVVEVAGDIERVTDKVNGDLIRASLPAQITSTIGYSSEPVIKPENLDVYGNIHVADYTKVRQLRYQDIEDGITVPPGLINLSAKLGREVVGLAEPALVMRNAQPRNFEFNFKPGVHKFTVLGAEGQPLPDDLQIKWTFSSGFEQVQFVASPTIERNLLSFDHEIRAEIDGLVASLNVAPSVGTSEPTDHQLYLSSQSIEEMVQLKYRILVPENVLFYETADLKLSLSDVGNGSEFPMRSNATNLIVPHGTYDLNLQSFGVGEKLSQIDLGTSSSIEINAQIPAAVLSIKTNPESDENTVWQIESEKGEQLKFQGTAFSQKLLPGIYVIEVTQDKKSAKEQIKVSIGDSVIEHVIDY